MPEIKDVSVQTERKERGAALALPSEGEEEERTSGGAHTLDRISKQSEK